MEIVVTYYQLALAGHLISVIAWLAGLLYLPRLFVYHRDTKVGSEVSETFKLMELRLLRGIMNPAMLGVWGFGLWLVVIQGMALFSGGWFETKLTIVILLTVFHMFLSVLRKRFEKDLRPYTSRTLRWINEIPTLFMVLIVILVILKPF